MPHVRLRFDQPMEAHRRTLLGKRQVVFSKTAPVQVSDAEAKEVLDRWPETLEAVIETKPGVWRPATAKPGKRPPRKRTDGPAEE